MKNQVIVALAVIVVLTAFSVNAGNASPQASLTLQSSGVVQQTPKPGTYSYIMSVSGSNYQMKNGTTFEVLYEDESSSSVFNNIIGNCSESYNVWVESGAYSVDATWDVTVNNLTIDFQSGAILTAVSDLAGSSIYLNFVNGCKIMGLTLNSNGDNQSLYGKFPDAMANGVSIVGFDNLIANSTIYNSREFGIFCPYWSFNCGVTNCTIYNCGANAIQLNGVGDYATGNDCWGCSDVLISTYGSDNYIADNYLHDTNGTTGYANSLWAIGVEGAHSGTNANVTITNNLIVNCGWGATSGNFANVTISDNIIICNDTDASLGIWDAGLSGCVIRNNTITGMNHVQGFSNSGIGIVAASHGSVITNNNISDCDSAGFNTFGSNNSTFSDNVVANSPIGFQVWYINGCVFSNNTLSDNTYALGFFSGANNNLFVNNTFSSNSSNLANVGVSTNSTFQGNIGLTDYRTLNITSDGHGTVAVSCGTQSLSSALGNLWQFPFGSTVTATAVPSAGYSFESWFLNGVPNSLNPININMNSMNSLELIDNSTWTNP